MSIFSDLATVKPPRFIHDWIDAADAQAKHIGDKVKDDAGETVGYAELAGFRYPVKAYQFKVTDTLTRGSRLDEAGLKDLASRGFKGVVNLCKEYDDSDKVKAAGLIPLHLPILDNTAPPEAMMKQFLDFANDPANQPTYVHCEAGMGRTGVAVACYRMGIQGWTADQAVEDGKKFGLQLESQITFLHDKFYPDLLAGTLAPYPLVASADASSTDSNPPDSSPPPDQSAGADSTSGATDPAPSLSVDNTQIKLGGAITLTIQNAFQQITITSDNDTGIAGLSQPFGPKDDGYASVPIWPTNAGTFTFTLNLDGKAVATAGPVTVSAPMATMTADKSQVQLGSPITLTIATSFNTNQSTGASEDGTADQPVGQPPELTVTSDNDTGDQSMGQPTYPDDNGNATVIVTPTNAGSFTFTLNIDGNAAATAGPVTVSAAVAAAPTAAAPTPTATMTVDNYVFQLGNPITLTIAIQIPNSNQAGGESEDGTGDQSGGQPLEFTVTSDNDTGDQSVGQPQSTDEYGNATVTVTPTIASDFTFTLNINGNAAATVGPVGVQTLGPGVDHGGAVDDSPGTPSLSVDNTQVKLGSPITLTIQNALQDGTHNPPQPQVTITSDNDTGDQSMGQPIWTDGADGNATIIVTPTNVGTFTFALNIDGGAVAIAGPVTVSSDAKASGAKASDAGSGAKPSGGASGDRSGGTASGKAASGRDAGSAKPSGAASGDRSGGAAVGGKAASGSDAGSAKPSGDPSGDPNTPGGDPNAPGGDPNASGGDPNTPGGDPNAPGGDPSGDPSADPSGDPSGAPNYDS